MYGDENPITPGSASNLGQQQATKGHVRGGGRGVAAISDRLPNHLASFV